MRYGGVPDRTEATDIESAASAQSFECPLVVAMRAMEQALLRERAAHAAGDVAGAARLRAERMGWRHLYSATCQQVCVALRPGAIDESAAAAIAGEALARMPDTVLAEELAALREQLIKCALLAEPDDCPVLHPGASARAGINSAG